MATPAQIAHCRRIAARGGRAVAKRKPPATCPRCDISTADRTWHSYIGHLGLHGLADQHFQGDIHAAQEHLRNNGLASQDPAPWNNAWPKYRPLPEEGS